MLTVTEVAARLGLSKMTVYRLIHSGDLRAVRVRRSLRVEQDEFEMYLRGVRTDGCARDGA